MMIAETVLVSVTVIFSGSGLFQMFAGILKGPATGTAILAQGFPGRAFTGEPGVVAFEI
jgi:hypothetical protein